MPYSYDRTASAPARIRVQMRLTEARKRKAELFASLGDIELGVLKVLASKHGSVYGSRHRHNHVVVTTKTVTPRLDSIGRPRSDKIDKKQDRKPWKKVVEGLERSGWLRYAEQTLPDDEHPAGNWYLTEGAEQALRAMAEGKPPLVDFRVQP